MKFLKNLRNKEIKEIKSRFELIGFLFLRIREKRKWWLLPIILLLAIFSLFINIFNNQSILPAIYTFF